MAQPGRDVVLHSAGPVVDRRLIYGRQPATGPHRRLRPRLQRKSRAVRLDQEKSPSAEVQKPPYHSAVIPGTSAAGRELFADNLLYSRSVNCNLASNLCVAGSCCPTTPTLRGFLHQVCNLHRMYDGGLSFDEFGAGGRESPAENTSPMAVR